MLDDTGNGSESGVIAGMEWAAGRHAKVVNMSLGSPFAADGTDPLEQALTRLTANGGPLFVVAAGNDGPGDASIGSPGETDAALTVGAVTKQDRLAEFSSRGPARSVAAIKPEITAPGVDIVAAKAARGQIGQSVGDSYTTLSGTSMATPHVAGAAAILAGQHPRWTAGQLKAALIGSAEPGARITVDQQGAGRVDVARAVSQPVYATPAALNAGVARWPHSDDPVLRQPVTYHNAGTAPVTLDLSLATSGPDGRPAAAGMFTLGRSRLTVPAGGTAAVRVTVDTTRGGRDGRYTGVLTAAGGDTAVRTPVAVTKEVESYDLRVRMLDRHGRPTPNYDLWFVSLDRPVDYRPYDPSGSVTVRLPKGRYFLAALVGTRVGPDEWSLDLTDITEPTIQVSRAGTMALDARRGRPVGVTVDRSEARPLVAEIDAERVANWGAVGYSLYTHDFVGVYAAPSTTAAPAGRFTFQVAALQARPGRNSDFAGSPYLYHVAWSADRRVPADLVRRAPDRGLAVTTATLAAASDSRLGYKEGYLPVTLPATLTEYYSPGLSWYQSLAELDASGNPATVQFGADGVFPVAGRAAPQRWNLPVFGPAFPAGGWPFVGRDGDALVADLALFSDAAPDHFGYSSTASGSTRLFRDGQLIQQEPYEGGIYATVPAEPATYRLETEATRTVSPLSTRLSAAWTFRSGHASDEDGAPLPVAVLRFAPPVDQLGRPPAGQRVLPVPVYLQRQTGGGFGPLASISVQASFDDGASWQSVSVLGSGDRRTAMIHQPARGGFVSLRATASDPAGDTVEQTIIRAYVLR